MKDDFFVLRCRWGEVGEMAIKMTSFPIEIDKHLLINELNGVAMKLSHADQKMGSERWGQGSTLVLMHGLFLYL